jgi:hypothetical protein
MRGKYSSVRGIERGVEQAMIQTDEILRKNVRDLQEQLQHQYIRNKELIKENNKLHKLLDGLNNAIVTKLGRAKDVEVSRKSSGNKKDSI